MAADTLAREMEILPMVSLKELPEQSTEETTAQAMTGAGPLVRESVKVAYDYNTDQARKRQEATERRLENVREDLKNLNNATRRFFDEHFRRHVLSSPFLANQFAESGSISETDWMSLADDELLVNALQRYVYSVRTQQPPILTEDGRITDFHTLPKPEVPVVPPQPIDLGEPNTEAIVNLRFEKVSA
jgi:hypothetical protein